MPAQLIQKCPLTAGRKVVECVLEDPSPEGFKRQPSVYTRQHRGDGPEVRTQRGQSLWGAATEFSTSTLHVDGRQLGNRLPDLALRDVGRNHCQMVRQVVPYGPLSAGLERPHGSIAGGLPVASELGQEASTRERP
jgi:hypothetical protein